MGALFKGKQARRPGAARRDPTPGPQRKIGYSQPIRCRPSVFLRAMVGANWWQSPFFAGGGRAPERTTGVSSTSRKTTGLATAYKSRVNAAGTSCEPSSRGTRGDPAQNGPAAFRAKPARQSSRAGREPTRSTVEAIRRFSSKGRGSQKRDPRYELQLCFRGSAALCCNRVRARFAVTGEAGDSVVMDACRSPWPHGSC